MKIREEGFLMLRELKGVGEGGGGNGGYWWERVHESSNKRGWRGGDEVSTIHNGAARIEGVG